MQAILAITVPFFALVACGYLAAARRVLPEAAIPGLNAFVLYFALPCLLLRFGQATPVAELLSPALLAVYLLAALCIVAVTIALTLGGTVGMKDAAFGALVAAFPNTGFMGVPLLVALLGPAAAGPLIATILADMIVTTSLCLALAQTGDLAGGTRPDAWRRILHAPLTNPLPWAIAVGAALSLTGLRLPGPLDAVVRMLGDAASPVALFTIGAVLWRAGGHARTRTPLARVLPVAAIKLLLHPLAVGVFGLAAMRLGLPLTPAQWTVLVLGAALPSASNVSLLAERHGADNGRVAHIIMASTVTAFASFTALAWLLEVRPAG